MCLLFTLRHVWNNFLLKSAKEGAVVLFPTDIFIQFFEEFTRKVVTTHYNSFRKRFTINVTKNAKSINLFDI
jgi:hypothetical protein